MNSSKKLLARARKLELKRKRGPDHNLRYKKEPIAGLLECKARYRKNEKGYRRRLYELLGSVYALAVRLSDDEEATERFYAEEYWIRERRREVKEKRDFFREVCKFVIDAKTPEARKLASKYAKVIFHLHEANVYPEDFAAAIEFSYGIEWIARNGMPKPEYRDPRDLGDGMTATGEIIDYGDKKTPKDMRKAIDYKNLELLENFLLAAAPGSNEHAQISAQFSADPDYPLITFYSVQPEDASRAAPGSATTSHRKKRTLEPLQIEMSARRRRRILRTEPGRVVQVVMKPIGTGVSKRFRAVIARRLGEEKARRRFLSE